jgi:YesN/AraC family two-component response regulator
MKDYLKKPFTKKGLVEWLKMKAKFKPQHSKRKKKKMWTEEEDAVKRLIGGNPTMESQELRCGLVEGLEC